MEYSALAGVTAAGMPVCPMFAEHADVNLRLAGVLSDANSCRNDDLLHATLSIIETHVMHLLSGCSLLLRSSQGRCHG
jgi:hypothetical protein